MDIPYGLTEAQQAAAALARNWTTDAASLARLDCEDCFAGAEEGALENGATNEEAPMWAASYIAQGDSLPCWRCDPDR